MRLFLGTAPVTTAAQLSQILLPLLVGALIATNSFDARSAGLLCSAELIVVAITSIAIAPMMGVWPRRNLALIGLIIAFAGHLLSASTTALPMLVAYRVLAGLGAGLMIAAANAAIASASQPDRFYSLVILLIGCTHFVVIGGVPFIIQRWSYAGAYIVEAIGMLLVLPFLLLMPQHGVKPAEGYRKKGFPLWSGIGVVLVISLFFARDTAVWAFSQQIGIRAGLSNQQIGLLLGVAGVLALAGAGLAVIIGTRFGRLKPMLVGLILNAGLSFWISQTSDPVVFAACQLVYNMAIFFTVPYFYGMAAALDPEGRVMAAAGGALLLGGALGPGIGGLLISTGGYVGIGVFILAAMTVVTIMAVAIEIMIQRNLARVQA